MNYTVYLVKAKALISFAVTAKLICAFVLAYAKSRFSHDVQLSINLLWRIGIFNAHKFGRKQSNKSDIVRGIPRKVLNILKQFLNKYLLIFS